MVQPPHFPCLTLRWRNKMWLDVSARFYSRASISADINKKMKNQDNALKIYTLEIKNRIAIGMRHRAVKSRNMM